MLQAYFKPTADFCKPYFSDWLWQCQDEQVTEFNVDPISVSSDSFIQSLTAINKISYNSKCELWPENYDARLEIDDRSQALKLSKNGGVIPYSFSKALSSFNAETYSFHVKLDIATAVKTSCDLSIVTNVSTVELGPLIEMVKHIRSEANNKIALKESIVELRTLPSAWSNLALLEDDIDGYILDLEDEILFAEGDEILTMELKDRILWLEDLKTDIKSGLEISTQCSANIGNNARCLKLASELKNKVDHFIDEDVSKLQAFENFVNAEIKRVEEMNAAYARKLNSILSQIQRVLGKYQS